MKYVLFTHKIYFEDFKVVII